jgi:plastocyanin
MRLHTRLTQLNGLTLLASAATLIALGACGGGDNSNAGASAGATTAATPPAGGAPAAGAPAGGAATAQQPTGQTHTVRMVGDGSTYKFDPANITIKRGDAVKWVMVSGGPHNVAFQEGQIPAGASAQLQANMPNTQAPLSSPMLMQPNEEYTVSFAGVPAGAYNYICTPHQAMGMKGTVTVQ